MVTVKFSGQIPWTGSFGRILFMTSAFLRLSVGVSMSPDCVVLYFIRLPKMEIINSCTRNAPV